jgi:CheY-like chemotaxis protein
MNDHVGLLLCDDLIFTSRITGAAKAAGLNVRAVKTSAELLRLARQATPRCVIADLNTPGLTIDEFAQELLALASKPMLVGYGSHVDAATLKAARDVGFDVVWPRSKFVEELATVLPAWFGER